MSVQHWSRLENVHRDLVRLVWDIGTQRDIDVAAGARSLADEQHDIDTGRSHLHDPANSKHVLVPGVREVAEAVDVTPHPVNWADIPAFIDLGHAFKARAQELSIPLKWGGDFNGPDKGFDYDHFELTEAA